MASPDCGGDWAQSGEALYAALTSAEAPPALREPLREATGVIAAALRLYGADRLLLSFNGGKDATVLLHLARAVFAAAGAGAPRCVYWEDGAAFPELTAFVDAAAARYGLPLQRYSGSYADGMRDAVAHGAAAVLLGTRAGDPNGGAAAAPFQPSSPGWPAFMRVNPLLHWAYHDVWRAARAFRLPMCALYGDGYTSLGNASNTRRNPALRRRDGSYAHAEALPSAALERGGRGAAEADAADVVRTVGLLRVSAAALRGAAEEHAAAAAQRLHGAARLTRVLLVPDAEADVADAARALAARCDALLVCCDDGDGAARAAAAVAAAFGLRLAPCAQLGGAMAPEGAAAAPGGLAALRVRSCTLLLAAPGPPAAAAAAADALCALLAADDAARVAPAAAVGGCD